MPVCTDCGYEIVLGTGCQCAGKRFVFDSPPPVFDKLEEVVRFLSDEAPADTTTKEIRKGVE